MSQFIPCPVCERGVSMIMLWRGIYLCTPCKDKYEKIEEIIKNGQVLEGPKLQTVLNYFGDKELDKIKESDTVRTTEAKKRRKRKKV